MTANEPAEPARELRPGLRRPTVGNVWSVARRRQPTISKAANFQRGSSRLKTEGVEGRYGKSQRHFESSDEQSVVRGPLATNRGPRTMHKVLRCDAVLRPITRHVKTCRHILLRLLNEINTSRSAWIAHYLGLQLIFRFQPIQHLGALAAGRA